MPHLLLALALTSLSQQVDCPVLVDVNVTPAPVSSVADALPYDVSSAPDGDLFFAGRSVSAGLELWRTDGTAAGTHQVADLMPGPIGSFPEDFCAVNGLLYFTATTPATGRELWVSDGTAAGTSMLGDLYSGSLSSDPAELFGWNGHLYFSARGDLTGKELWKSDGTQAGTHIVKDINPNTSSSNPFHFRALPDGSGIFFVATDQSGKEPWRSDGTTAGTYQILDINPGSASGMNEFYSPFIYGNHVLWLNTNNTIFRTDGTAAGTTFQNIAGLPVNTELKQGLGGSILGNLYFVENDKGKAEVWTINLDTWQATQFFDHIDLGGTTSISHFMPMGGEMYFIQGGFQLFAVRADPSSLRLVKQISGVESSGRAGVTGSHIYFALKFSDDIWRLWSSDGTGAGTQQLSDVEVSGWPGNVPLGHALPTGKVGVFGYRDTVGWELFETDGTSAGTNLLVDLMSAVGTADGLPMEITRIGADTFYFSAMDGTFGREPYRWSPSGGLEFLGDVNPGWVGSDPRGFTQVVIGDEPVVLFMANDGTTGNELYKVDASGSASLVTELNPGSAYGSGPDFADIGGLALFTGTTTEFGSELYVTDGTAQGTQLLVDLEPGSSGGAPRRFFDMGERVLFTASVWPLGVELYVTDGTPSGTQLLAEFEPDTFSFNVDRYTRLGDRVLFVGSQHGGKSGLFVTDGTPAGTMKLASLGPVAVVAPRDELAVLNGVAYLLNNGPTAYELWRSDGTVAGTYKAFDLSPISTKARYTDLVATSSHLYMGLQVVGDNTGVELWATDGTQNGLYRVGDLAPGPDHAYIDNLTAFGDLVYFTGKAGPQAPVELYVSDGLSIDLVCDPSPGAALFGIDEEFSTSPTDLTPFAGGLAFVGASPANGGNELHVLLDPGARAIDLGLAGSNLYLEVDAPDLGAQIDLEVHGGPAQGTTYIVMSPPIAKPLHGAALSPSDLLWLNPSAFTILAAQMAPSFGHTLSIPSAPTFAGLPIAVQGLAIDPAGAGGLQTSNGVLAVLGN